MITVSHELNTAVNLRIADSGQINGPTNRTGRLLDSQPNKALNLSLATIFN